MSDTRTIVPYLAQCPLVDLSLAYPKLNTQLTGVLKLANDPEIRTKRKYGPRFTSVTEISPKVTAPTRSNRPWGLRKLDDGDRTDLIAEYNRGVTQLVLAMKYGISPATVKRFAKKMRDSGAVTR